MEIITTDEALLSSTKNGNNRRKNDLRMCLFYSKNGSQAYKNFTGKVISVSTMPRMSIHLRMGSYIVLMICLL